MNINFQPRFSAQWNTRFTAATSFTANQTLHDVWPSPAGWYTICTLFNGFCPLTEFCAVQTSLCVQVLRIGSITAQYSNSGRQSNFASWYKEWNYETFADGTTYIRLGGHHVGHRPTF